MTRATRTTRTHTRTTLAAAGLVLTAALTGCGASAQELAEADAITAWAHRWDTQVTQVTQTPIHDKTAAGQAGEVAAATVGQCQARLKTHTKAADALLADAPPALRMGAANALDLRGQALAACAAGDVDTPLAGRSWNTAAGVGERARELADELRR